MTDISQYSGVILSLLGAMGILYVLYMLRMITAQMRDQREYGRAIEDRLFYSSYDKGRVDLEQRIAEINRKLTDTVEEFNRVNHLLVDGQNYASRGGEGRVVLNSFLKGMNIQPNDLKVDPTLIFVLTPFSPRERLTYSAIVEAFAGLDVKVRRGDEVSLTQDILSHIVRQIVSARLVIANISSRNPNVMYELGIAHALGKHVIMVSSSEEKLPFDMRNRRVLLYSSREDLIGKLRDEVARKLLSDLETPSNS